MNINNKSKLTRAVIMTTFNLVDALVGWIWLHDKLDWSYWNFLGVAIFGYAIVASAIVMNQD